MEEYFECMARITRVMQYATECGRIDLLKILTGLHSRLCAHVTGREDVDIDEIEIDLYAVTSVLNNL